MALPRDIPCVAEPYSIDGAATAAKRPPAFVHRADASLPQAGSRPATPDLTPAGSPVGSPSPTVTGASTPRLTPSPPRGVHRPWSPPASEGRPPNGAAMGTSQRSPPPPPPPPPLPPLGHADAVRPGLGQTMLSSIILPADMDGDGDGDGDGDRDGDGAAGPALPHRYGYGAYDGARGGGDGVLSGSSDGAGAGASAPLHGMRAPRPVRLRAASAQSYNSDSNVGAPPTGAAAAAVHAAHATLRTRRSAASLSTRSTSPWPAIARLVHPGRAYGRPTPPTFRPTGPPSPGPAAAGGAPAAAGLDPTRTPTHSSAASLASHGPTWRSRFRMPFFKPPPRSASLQPSTAPADAATAAAAGPLVARPPHSAPSTPLPQHPILVASHRSRSFLRSMSSGSGAESDGNGSAGLPLAGLPLAALRPLSPAPSLRCGSGTGPTSLRCGSPSPGATLPLRARDRDETALRDPYRLGLRSYLDTPGTAELSSSSGVGYSSGEESPGAASIAGGPTPPTLPRVPRRGSSMPLGAVPRPTGVGAVGTSPSPGSVGGSRGTLLRHPEAATAAATTAAAEPKHGWFRQALRKAPSMFGLKSRFRRREAPASAGAAPAPVSSSVSLVEGPRSTWPQAGLRGRSVSASAGSAMAAASPDGGSRRRGGLLQVLRPQRSTVFQ
ncbi:hypothetical protein CXG81DRAFT_25178 [Caulochytrium protostelioides]|uniref:Uncharacterized protein n=1 Tax=Caulochytrium protostelioides TaxID=1555241 RepID=A0A4P9X9Z1_9FUNG|nr:hypothetical protein CXG81DRAFT_25178 [Caulochytrium protostelioides]|eukprot:RKP02158.1 hypothetical protein CXG81DRAFT_25178 [Caulochytrium protostelioides]